MKNIVLISCSKKKLPHRAKAKHLYASTLFKLNLDYAKSLRPSKIFILSAKHGLLDPEKKIDPYDATLNDMSAKEIKRWADKVIRQLSGTVNLRRDRMILLAGERYRRYLVPHFSNYQVPLKGLGIGKQLRFLKLKTSE